MRMQEFRLWNMQQPRLKKSHVENIDKITHTLAHNCAWYNITITNSGDCNTAPPNRTWNRRKFRLRDIMFGQVN